MKRVLLDIQDGITRVALVEDGKLVELYYETKRETSLVGNIYVGRIDNVIPNLQACFVEIGSERKGYLYYGNARAVSDEGKNTARPKAGDTIIVQVEKDAVGAKGAVLTQKISFPGKFLVLVEEDGEIGISRKITDGEERERIRRVIKKVLPKGYGAVVRTNGQGKSETDYEKEISILLEKGRSIANWEFRKAPVLLLQQSLPVEKAVRDFYSESIHEFVVNNQEVYEYLLETGDFNGENQPKLLLYQGRLPIFEEFFVESQSQKALDPKVWLKSGGFLVIQETEACVVIDVNSGKGAGKGDLEKSIVKTNLEAAVEVAKQLRLRNLSGIIIVDFIDMSSQENKNNVTKALENAVKKDRIKTVVVGMTELGLMQITRKKTRPSLSTQMTTRCRQCQGQGRVPSIDWTVTKMRGEVESILANTIYNKVTVRADSRLLFAFRGQGDTYLNSLSQSFGGTVICESSDKFGFSLYEIVKEKQG
ncbi:Rne/Rng family ribonuclease [Anaerotignum sp. MB30-C6]|uniref:Rne/Rng family ribonuclease n=1 Tax=Anaerotignum sp. MB30-C6 TaxID=3070814 RepID=UPI0027DC9EAE|nr:Rne/Rng family ribonuclease [Anaerotignum sp. MB30-C6]WMI80438.1 Rne/Rng family ribonuclease [Anaerotignum sp. MB30-C6]